MYADMIYTFKKIKTILSISGNFQIVANPSIVIATVSSLYRVMSSGQNLLPFTGVSQLHKNSPFSFNTLAFID